MTFKSYAQAGQFGKYHIDLPIKAEINEDLRAAGDFAKQMQRSQKYREKWASSYLSALNDKSKIERQNRDDNFEFLQNNFKRIYEGEQREFDGRLAELQREQAEAANAAPGFWDDLLPALIQAAPQIVGIIGGMQSAKLEGQKQFATEMLTAAPDVTAAQLNSNQRLFQSGLLTDSDAVQIAQNFADNHMPGASASQVRELFQMTGEAQMHSQLTAFQNDIPRINQQLLSISMTGSGERFDPSLPQYQGTAGQAKYIQEFRQYTQEVIDSSYGSGSREHYSDDVNFGVVQKVATNIQNSVFSKANNTWEGQAKSYNEQTRVQQLNNAIGQGPQGIQTHYQGVLARESQRKDSNGQPIPLEQARYNAVEVLGERWKKSTGTYDDFVQWRKINDAEKAAMGHHQRGGPIDRKLDEIGLMLQEKSNTIQRVHTQAQLNNHKKIVKQSKAEYDRIFETEGRVAADDFINKARQKNWEHNPEMLKWLNGMASSPAVSRPANNKTVEERTGIKRADFERAASVVALEGLGESAANNKLGAVGMRKLGSTTIARDKILGHMQANWTAYERKYAGVYAPGSESLLQQAAYDSYKTLKDGGALPIKNEGSKVPTELTEYNFGIGENSVINNTVEYRNLTKQKPNEYHQLYQSDKAQFKNYADTVSRVRQMGGDVNTPAEYTARVNLHNMAAVKERATALGITVDESADQILDNLGYPDAITDPFTKKDAQSNSQILNRIYDQSKTTTNQGYAAGQAAKSGTLQFAAHVPHDITAPFGEQRSTGTHYGTDIAGAGVGAQSSVVPITITNLENSAGGGKGWQGIFQTHTNQKVEIRSLHHSELYGKIGETIQPGTAIAEVGSTGRSTGPHQHLEFYIDGKLVDGETTLPGDDKRLIDYIVGHKL